MEVAEAGRAGLRRAGVGLGRARLGYGPVLARLSWWEISAQKSFSRDLAISMCSTLMLACRAWFTQRKLFFFLPCTSTTTHSHIHTCTVYDFAKFCIQFGGIRFLRSKETKKKKNFAIGLYPRFNLCSVLLSFHPG